METMNAIMQRHTVMDYTSQPVERGQIEKLLEAARWAPSGGNSQPWDFIVVDEPEVKAKVKEIVRESYARWMTTAVPQACTPDEIEGAQCFLDSFTGEGVAFVVATLTFREDPNPARRAKREFVEVMNHQSIGLALQNLMLAATDEGLGTHWLAPVALMQDEMHELLGIPEETEVVALLTLGHPSSRSQSVGGQERPRTRFPLEQIAHFNGW